MKNYIGVFDSGIGGLTTLNEIVNLLPNENYIYYADSKNNPYGEKSDDELYLITKNIVNKMLKKKVKLIIIACNTATTKCINKLRNEYKNIEFIGTEPAIKVACDKNYKNILLLATSSTIESNRLKELIKENKKSNQNITLLKCHGLAESIEKNNDDEIDKLLKDLFKNIKNISYDSIVLACTHYPYIKDKIKKYFKNADIIDGNIGVANRVKYILETKNLKNNSNKKGIIKIYKSLKK